MTPSIIYSDAILKMAGRYGEKRTIDVKGIAHITGGGITSKLGRVLRASGLGADLTEIWPPHDALRDIIALGSVETEEAYRTWNMGNGMMIILKKIHADEALEILNISGIEAKLSGTVSKQRGIRFLAFDGAKLTF